MINSRDNNRVAVVGYISEIDIKSRSKNGRDYVFGNIKVQVTPDNIIPIYVIAFDNGNTNPNQSNNAYEQVCAVRDKGVSLASVGGDTSKATKIRTTFGRLEENAFVSGFGNLVSTPRVSSNYFTMGKIIENPKANFHCYINVRNIREEVDGNDEPTGRLIVDGALKQYKRWDVISFIVENQQAVDYVQSNWNVGDTVAISGRIENRTTTSTVTNEAEGGFGEPEVETRTFHKTEYVIVSGSEPKEEEFSFNVEEVEQGLRDRQLRFDELKENKNTTVKAARVDDSDF